MPTAWDITRAALFGWKQQKLGEREEIVFDRAYPTIYEADTSMEAFVGMEFPNTLTSFSAIANSSSSSGVFIDNSDDDVPPYSPTLNYSLEEMEIYFQQHAARRAANADAASSCEGSFYELPLPVALD